jgi:hypothetical protein
MNYLKYPMELNTAISKVQKGKHVFGLVDVSSQTFFLRPMGLVDFGGLEEQVQTHFIGQVSTQIESGTHCDQVVAQRGQGEVV